jgi:hypothetical protein
MFRYMFLLVFRVSSHVGIQNNDRSPCSSTSSSTIDVIVDDIVAKRRTHVRDVMCSRPERHLFTSSGNKIRVHVTGDVSDSGGRTLLMHFTGERECWDWFFMIVSVHI